MPDGTRNNRLGQAVRANLSAICYRANLAHTPTARLKHQSIFIDESGASIDTEAFLIKSCNLFPQGLGIDFMGSDDRGTGNQKACYKVACIQQKWNMPGILIIAGKDRGYAAARNWARTQIGGNLFAVLSSTDDFADWLDQCIRADSIQRQYQQPQGESLPPVQVTLDL